MDDLDPPESVAIFNNVRIAKAAEELTFLASRELGSGNSDNACTADLGSVLS